MLLDHVAGVRHNPAIEKEVSWLGNSFRDFLGNASDERVLAQLLMFDGMLDVKSALENLARCEEVLFTDRLATDLPSLGNRLGLSLRNRHTRKGITNPRLGSGDLAALKERIRPELEFWEAARKDRNRT
jgi:hypothetical protein